MIRATLTTLAAAACLVAAPAFSQFPDPAPPTPPPGGWVYGGEEGPWQGPVAAGDQKPYSPQDLAEVPFTHLLNQMSRQGYAAYRSIRREGDVYVVEAMTTDFELVTLVVDPRTGQITQR